MGIAEQLVAALARLGHLQLMATIGVVMNASIALHQQLILLLPTAGVLLAAPRIVALISPLF